MRWDTSATREITAQKAWAFVTVARVPDDLAAEISAMRAAGVAFRNEMEVGPGGKQIQIEDPDGNPIELFEPAERA